MHICAENWLLHEHVDFIYGGLCLDLGGDLVHKEHYFGWREFWCLNVDEFGQHHWKSLTCMVVKDYQLVVLVLIANFFTYQFKRIAAVNRLVRLQLELLYLTLDCKQTVDVCVDDQNLVQHD